MKRLIAVVVALLIAAPPALPCSACNLGANANTLRQDVGQAKLVLFGALSDPALNPNDPAGVNGTTKFTIDKVIKTDPFLGNTKVVTLPRYVPVDAKNPPKFLIFCDVFKGKDDKERLDPYRGIPVKSPEIVAYLQGALALDAKDRSKMLLYYFDHLEHRDPTIADDAFLELAKASDQELVQVASKFSADKLRGWVQAEATQGNRLSLYGFLLGLCGSDKDAAVLEAALRNPSPRNQSALDGLLWGYIELRPRDGWNMVQAGLKDATKPFTQRFALLRTLRFYHGYKPQESRKEILGGLAVALDQGDIADLAVEDLRRWQIWDLTPEVLAQYGKKSHDAPIVKRSIVRYALSCPRPEATRFVGEVRGRDANLVKDVEESLQFEKQK